MRRDEIQTLSVVIGEALPSSFFRVSATPSDLAISGAFHTSSTKTAAVNHYLIHLVTHLVWPHQQDKPTGETLGLADQSMKSPSCLS